jgi:hypothetical protein
MEYGRELIGSIIVASEGNLVKENIFLISKLGKTFRYIFILHFCIVLANSIREEGERELLSSTLPTSQSNGNIGISSTRDY